MSNPRLIQPRIAPLPAWVVTSQHSASRPSSADRPAETTDDITKGAATCHIIRRSHPRHGVTQLPASCYDLTGVPPLRPRPHDPNAYPGRTPEVGEPSPENRCRSIESNRSLFLEPRTGDLPPLISSSQCAGAFWENGKFFASGAVGLRPRLSSFVGCRRALDDAPLFMRPSLLSRRVAEVLARLVRHRKLAGSRRARSVPSDGPIRGTGGFHRNRVRINPGQVRRSGRRESGADRLCYRTP